MFAAGLCAFVQQTIFKDFEADNVKSLLKMTIALKNVYGSPLCTDNSAVVMIWCVILHEIVGYFDYSDDCTECVQLAFVHGTNDMDVLYDVW